jgi:hypothetical protein
MSYHLCPNFINTVLNEISLNKCYHHPQSADTLPISLNPQPTDTSLNPQPADILPLLPFISLYITFLLFILLVYTNLFQNIIILFLTSIKLTCKAFLSLPLLLSYLSNLFHSFKHLILSILLSILLFTLYSLYYIICILLFSYSFFLYKVIYLVLNINSLSPILIFSHYFFYYMICILHFFYSFLYKIIIINSEF